MNLTKDEAEYVRKRDGVLKVYEDEIFYGAQYYHLVVCSIEKISPSIRRDKIVTSNLI